jgi:hypothetical protein
MQHYHHEFHLGLSDKVHDQFHYRYMPVHQLMNCDQTLQLQTGGTGSSDCEKQSHGKLPRKVRVECC